jgi:hypothetical protein
MAFGLWDVQGKFVIPGTRKAIEAGPIRVLGEDTPKGRKAMSESLATHLNEKFAKELRGDSKFSKDFALYNMRWERYQLPKVEAPIPETLKA